MWNRARYLLIERRLIIVTLSASKSTREERAAMTKDELIRTVWLLDDVIESLRWIPIKEMQPKYD
jgi:hypothetical protein